MSSMTTTRRRYLLVVCTLSRRAIATSTRRFDAKHVAGMQLELDFPRQPLFATRKHESIAATRAGTPPAQAVWCIPRAIRKDSYRRVRQKLVLTDQPLSTGESACATTAGAQPVTANPNRKIIFDCFDRRIASVAHVRVHPTQARQPTPPAHSAAKGFIVCKARTGSG